ncbi:MAG: hypothetical protein IJS82_04895 [Paludibacteraceae bacterium]|jgi:hypothetical protein|nr:hypothetical protein [Paludibacteraceae bacterium]
MSESAFLTFEVENIRTEDIMAMVESRDFKTRLLVFPSADLRKKAQSMTSWLSKTKLRPIGLNLTTKTGDEDNTLLLKLEEYNNG